MTKDIHAYEGNLKTRRAKQKASQAAIFEGHINRSPHSRSISKNHLSAKNTEKKPGNIKVPVKTIRLLLQKINSRVTGNWTGPLIYKRHTQKAAARYYHKQARQVGRYEGQIKVYGKSKAVDYSFYQGYIKARTPGHQTYHLKKLSKKVHQFNGLISVRKSGKDMHPSISYLKSKTKKSYEQKEKYRKWKIKWYRWLKFKDQPKHLKTKSRKPRYDNKEREIWYY